MAARLWGRRGGGCGGQEGAGWSDGVLFGVLFGNGVGVCGGLPVPGGRQSPRCWVQHQAGGGDRRDVALGPHPWQVRVSPAPSSYSQPEMPAETKVLRPGEAGQPGAGVPPLPGLCSITAGAPTDPLLTLLLRGLPGSPLLLGVSPWILVGLRSGRRCHLVPRSQALCWGVLTTVTAAGAPLMPPHVTALGGRCRAAVPPRSQHRSLVALPMWG